ncbi:MAG: MFS transporter [Acidimicrobiales bacterium]|nr:MFS transporter [Acidimicrobiales bacterium]
MRRPWLTLAVVVMASVQVAMTLSVVFVVFVDLDDYFPNASSAQLSWAINAFTIVLASTVVLGSAIADRYGRKRVAIVGALIFALGSVIAGTAPGIAVLIFGRCVQALGAAAFGPASLALVLDAFPFERRGIAMGVFTMGGAFAAGSGPALGGIIVDNLGWRWAFLAVVPVGVLAAAVGSVVWVESEETKTERLPDPVGSLLILSGVGLLVLSLVQSKDWGWVDGRTALSAIAGLVFLGTLLRRSASHPRPTIDLTLFRHRTFRAGSISFGVFATSFFAMTFSAVLYLTEVWNYDLDKAGLLAAPFFLATGVAGPVAGRLVDRVGPRPLVIAGTLLWAATITVLALVIDEQRNVGLWLALLITAGIGSGFYWGAAPTLSVEGLDGPRFAAAGGINQTLQNIGSSFAIAIAITLLGDDPTRNDFSPVFVVVVLAAVVTTMVVATADGRPALARLEEDAHGLPN